MFCTPRIENNKKSGIQLAKASLDTAKQRSWVGNVSGPWINSLGQKTEQCKRALNERVKAGVKYRLSACSEFAMCKGSFRILYSDSSLVQHAFPTS